MPSAVSKFFFEFKLLHRASLRKVKINKEKVYTPEFKINTHIGQNFRIALIENLCYWL